MLKLVRELLTHIKVKLQLQDFSDTPFSVAKATLQSQMSVCLLVTKTPQLLRINPIYLSKSCLLIIMPINHKAYELSDLLLQLLSLSACFEL